MNQDEIQQKMELLFLAIKQAQQEGSAAGSARQWCKTIGLAKDVLGAFVDDGELAELAAPLSTAYDDLDDRFQARKEAEEEAERQEEAKRQKAAEKKGSRRKRKKKKGRAAAGGSDSG